MTLDELLLQKLAKWRPDTNCPTLEVNDPASGWTINLTADCVEQIGSRLNELTLARTVPLAAGDLKARADRVASQVTGLLEPLRLIEIDTERSTALLRSNDPSQRGEDLFYYELLLQGDGGCALRRYQASQRTGTRRQAVTFNLTHDALGKLVNDLTR
jgi:hypothetical protein